MKIRNQQRLAAPGWLLATTLALAVTCAAACRSRTAADEVREIDTQAEEAKARGNYRETLRLRGDAVEASVKAHGEFSEPTAKAMHNLGVAFLDVDDLTNGIGTLRRVLQILEQVKGPNDLGIADAGDELGRGYIARGNFRRAAEILTRTVMIRSKALGSATPKLARTSLYLAQVSAAMSNWAMAEALYGIAQTSFEKTEGPKGLHVAKALAGLADCARAKQDYADAGQKLDQALSFAQSAPGVTNLDVAELLTRRADLHIYVGEYDRVAPLLTRAESLLLRAVGPQAAPMAPFLEVAAKQLLYGRRDFQNAEDYLLRALALREKYTASDSAYTASVLSVLVEVYWTKDDLPRAVDTLAKLVRISESAIVNAANAFSLMDDLSRFQPLAAHQFERDFALSLADQARSDAAQRLALLTLLQRKGRLIDLLGAEVRAARQHTKPGTAASLDAFLGASRAQAHAEFSALVNGGNPSNLRQQVQVTPTVRERERALAQILGVPLEDTTAFAEAVNAALNSTPVDVSVEGVAQRIPRGAALVEFAKYGWSDPRKDDLPTGRYAAFVLQSDGKVAYADLGDSDSIEALVTRFRAGLANPSVDTKATARALDERVMRPVRALLGSTRKLLVAPEFALSLVPFGALIDERGAYLVEKFSFNWLTTGRELYSLSAARSPSREKSVVVADPDFGSLARAADAREASRGASVAMLRRAAFTPLPGTAEEGRKVAQVLDADLLAGSGATRQALSGRHGPRVLHVATHGFFLDDLSGGAKKTRGLELSEAEAAAPVDALYRSGLVFAGANLNGATDSILSAKEAVSLDLAGTELVVLSACETGVGESSTGQGVRGLQQAFVVAGARSIVMSLWKVDDEATRDLMIAFYDALSQGKGPTLALQAAQLRMLASPRSHPYYWASFIPYGDPSPLAAGAFRGVSRP